MALCLLYCTASSEAEASKISRILLEKNLVACSNIVSKSKSLFKWKSKVKSTREVVFILKSQRSKLKQVLSQIKKHHSYECPCVVEIPISRGNPDFLKWIKNETT